MIYSLSSEHLVEPKNVNIQFSLYIIHVKLNTHAFNLLIINQTYMHHVKKCRSPLIELTHINMHVIVCLIIVRLIIS